MMPFQIVRNDITQIQVDAIVNTTNPHPKVGSGVDMGIHIAAGPDLLKARKEIGDINPGECVITPGFNLRARYVIHTVGPVWVNGESHLDCIKRECVEEVGYSPCVERKLCSAEAYMKHPTIGYFHPIQTYYIGKLLDRKSTPTETDHNLCWIEYNQLRGNMFVEMQNWALELLYTCF